MSSFTMSTTVWRPYRLRELGARTRTICPPGGRRREQPVGSGRREVIDGRESGEVVVGTCA